MKKKILLGCIISIILLILVSLTIVIGYRSAESNDKLYRLFKIRSNKTILNDKKDFTCDYILKGGKK